MKRVPGMDGADDFTTMRMYLIPLNRTLKKGYDGTFCYVYLPP